MVGEKVSNNSKKGTVYKIIKINKFLKEVKSGSRQTT